MVKLFASIHWQEGWFLWNLCPETNNYSVLHSNKLHILVHCTCFRCLWQSIIPSYITLNSIICTSSLFVHITHDLYILVLASQTDSIRLWDSMTKTKCRCHQQMTDHCMCVWVWVCVCVCVRMHACEYVHKSTAKLLWGFEDVALVEFMYLAFMRTPAECYRRRRRSLMLCLCDVFQALIQLPWELMLWGYFFYCHPSDCMKRACDAILHGIPFN